MAGLVSNCVFFRRNFVRGWVNVVTNLRASLRSYNLSRTKVTEYDLILARAGKFNRSHE